MRITISEVLRYRARLAGMLAQLDERIKSNNSTPKGTTTLDVRELLTQRSKVVADLIGVKLALFKANEAQQTKILELAELKGLIKILQETPTLDGPKPSHYGTADPVPYVAQIGQEEMDRLCKTVQRDIDRLQSELDAANHATYVEVTTRESVS